MADHRRWPFGELRPFSYGAILADPPWQFKLWSAEGEGKSAQAQYDCLDLDLIKAMPVADLAQRDCLLFMWATAPMLPQALEVMAAWQFRFITSGAWVKRTATGKAAFGTGYVLRSAVEPFLIGVMGHPDYQSRSERNLIDAKRRRHSQKPPEQYELLERLVPSAPKLELFARSHRAGWDGWGNQLGEAGEE